MSVFGRPLVRDSRFSTVLARNRLGVGAVVSFVMAAAAPLTVIAGGATAGYAITRSLGIPVSYVAVAVVLAVFAVGYVAMARRIVNAGAFYTYVARGLCREAGVGAAFVALLGYNCMQIGLYGGFGFVLADLLGVRAGVVVPWWVCAFAGWLVVGVLGVLRIDVSGRVLAVLLTAEVVIAVVYDAVMLSHPAGHMVSLVTLSPSHLFEASAGAALVTAITGFVGFESTVVFAEETRDPRRTIARATYIAVVVTGVLYGGSAWAMSVTTGPDRIVAAATSDGPELMFNLVSPYVWSVLVDVGHVLFVTSLFAALLSFHNTVARYTFSLGRERVLPAAWGRTNPRTGAPQAGSLLQSGLAFGVLVLYAVAGWDPYVNLFFGVTVSGGLGVLVLMLLTSIAVVGFFRRHPDHESVWRRTVAPSIATVALGVILVATVLQFHLLLGVTADSPWRWIVPAAYAAVGLVGVGWALLLRVRRPAAYAAIGLGANTPTPPMPGAFVHA
jgi:amino acid transporter